MMEVLTIQGKSSSRTWIWYTFWNMFASMTGDTGSLDQGVVQAFYAGSKKIEHLDYDVIAKMDGDLQFPRETFQTIAKRFLDEPKFGVTGVVRYERTTRQDQMKRVTVAKGHVTGAFKFYRKECFEDIGGLIPRAGWDGVDIVRARMKGWETGEIDSRKLLPLTTYRYSKG